MRSINASEAITAGNDADLLSAAILPGYPTKMGDVVTPEEIAAAYWPNQVGAPLRARLWLTKPPADELITDATASAERDMFRRSARFIALVRLMSYPGATEHEQMLAGHIVGAHVTSVFGSAAPARNVLETPVLPGGTVRVGELLTVEDMVERVVAFGAATGSPAATTEQRQMIAQNMRRYLTDADDAMMRGMDRLLCAHWRQEARWLAMDRLAAREGAPQAERMRAIDIMQTRTRHRVPERARTQA